MLIFIRATDDTIDQLPKKKTNQKKTKQKQNKTKW